MTRERRQFSDGERARIGQGIERVFTFVQDVLDDPQVLSNLPERANIQLTPLAEKADDRHYQAETRHFAVTVEGDESAPRQTHSA
jgi:hypothetical protein